MEEHPEGRIRGANRRLFGRVCAGAFAALKPISLGGCLFTWRFQRTAATAPRHTGIAEALRREPTFLRRWALAVSTRNETFLFLVKQDEQQAGQPQQEGIEQQSALPPLYLAVSNIGVLFILWFGGKNVLGTGWQNWNIAAFTTFLFCFVRMAAKSSRPPSCLTPCSGRRCPESASSL